MTLAIEALSRRGMHHRAHFEVRESDRSVAVHLASNDRSAEFDVEVEISDSLPESRLVYRKAPPYSIARC